MEPFLVTFDPTAASTVEPMVHEGEEFLHVLSGTLELLYDGETYTLKKGDSLYIDSSHPHALRGIGKTAPQALAGQILLASAENEPLVDQTNKPMVRFTEYADSSINFDLLVWIDVRQTPRRKVRSNLYFVIFEELDKAGVEIPFPQRDVHIRSQADAT